MQEVKTPKKPLIYYYGIVMLILCLFNLIVTPMLLQHQVVEVDYGTFMRMIEEGDIGQVEITDTQITFTNKDHTNFYKTGVMNDPTITQGSMTAARYSPKILWRPLRRCSVSYCPSFCR